MAVYRIGEKRAFMMSLMNFLNEDEEQELMYDHKDYKNPNIITCASLTDQYEKLLKNNRN